MVMNLRETALAAYYYSSAPLRRWWRNRETAPVSILFYHRVSDRHPTGWTMSTAMFQQQMDFIEEHLEPVSMDRALEIVRGEATTEKPAVCITFDDGYGDNVDFALPLIIDRQLPCTYFVSQHFVATGEPFPHDVQLGNPLPPNTIAELRDMAEAGIEIGAHTRTHADLATVTDEEQMYDEVVTAGLELARAVGQPMKYLAFPFGLYSNLSPKAFAMAKRAGYRAVFSAYGGYNFPGDDPFHLQRIHGDDCIVRFKNWLTVDPRWRRLVKRYNYEDDPAYQQYMAKSLPHNQPLGCAASAGECQRRPSNPTLP